MTEREVCDYENKQPLDEVNIGHEFCFEGWKIEVIGIIKYRENTLYVLKNTCASNEIKVTICVGELRPIPVKGKENFRTIKTFFEKDKYNNLCKFLEIFFKY